MGILVDCEYEISNLLGMLALLQGVWKLIGTTSVLGHTPFPLSKRQMDNRTDGRKSPSMSQTKKKVFVARYEEI